MPGEDKVTAFFLRSTKAADRVSKNAVGPVAVFVMARTTAHSPA
jgi:hypothetical protein